MRRMEFLSYLGAVPLVFDIYIYSLFEYLDPEGGSRKNPSGSAEPQMDG